MGGGGQRIRQGQQSDGGPSQRLVDCSRQVYQEKIHKERMLDFVVTCFYLGAAR